MQQTPSESGADIESSLIISRLRKRLFSIDSQTSFGPKNRYRIEDRKGSGGMANVYKAHDSHLGVPVALKLLRADPWRTGGSAPSDGQRLIREAQSLAQTPQAKHVARVYDAAEHDGTFYISMEYVDGVDLRRFQRERGRTQREIVDAYLEAGRGLAELHRAGLAHLDFKPENVVVETARPGCPRRAVLVDLGLAARIGDKPLGGQASLYTFGGTPAYAAPERLTGRSFDARADQFSFCVAFYEALFRSHPFFGPTLEEFVSTTRDERPEIAESTLRLKYVHDIQAAICRGQRTPAPRDLRLPWGMMAALERGMHFDPERRFAGMEELLRTLTRGRRVLDGIKRIGLPVAAGLAFGAFGLNYYVESTVCTGFEQRVAAVWSPSDATVIRQALVGAPDVELIIGALDEFSEAWTTAQEAACTDVRKTGRHGEAWLERRTQCLDRALGVAGVMRRRIVEGNAVDAVGPELLTILGGRLGECEHDDATDDPTALRADDPLVQQLDELSVAALFDPHDEVRATAARLLAQAEQRGDPTIIAEAAFRLAHVLGQLMRDPVDGPAHFAAADVALARAIAAAGEARRPHLVAAAMIFRGKLEATAASEVAGFDTLSARLADAEGLALSLDRVDLEAEAVETRGIHLLRSGRFALAIDALQHSVRLREVLLDHARRQGPGETDRTLLSLRIPLAKTLSNLGEAYNQGGRLGEARRAIERSIVEWQTIAGETSVYTLETRLNLLQVLQDLGATAAAGAERAAIAARLDEMHAEDPHAAARERALPIRWALVTAQGYLDAGRHEEALKTLEPLLAGTLPPMKRSEALLMRAEACTKLRRWACVREAAGQVLEMNGAGDSEHVKEARQLLAGAANETPANEPPPIPQ